MDLIEFLYLFKDEQTLYRDSLLSKYSNASLNALTTKAKDLKLLASSTGQGFLGLVESYSITEAGKEYIKHYCTACGCIPCDCDWGN